MASVDKSDPWPARKLGPQFFDHDEINSGKDLNELRRGLQASEEITVWP